MKCPLPQMLNCHIVHLKVHSIIRNDTVEKFHDVIHICHICHICHTYMPALVADSGNVVIVDITQSLDNIALHSWDDTSRY